MLAEHSPAEMASLIMRFVRRLVSRGQSSAALPSDEALGAWGSKPAPGVLKRDFAYFNLPLVTEGGPIGYLNLSLRAPSALAAVQAEPDDEIADADALLLEPEPVITSLTRANEWLGRRVVELEARVATAEDEDQLRRKFVSDVAHELRAPVTNIKLYLSLLESGRPEKAREYLAVLRREADVLHSLIEDLLDLSRLDQGKLHPDLVLVDLNRLASILVADRKAMAEECNHSLELSLESDLPPVLADPRMSAQILSNLLSNAINYSSPGSKVTVATSMLEVDGQTWLTLSVADEGPGIGLEEQLLLFDRFYRGQAAVDGDVPGTGLGLSICQELARIHGGRITLDSQPDRGSIFSLWLLPAG